MNTKKFKEETCGRCGKAFQCFLFINCQCEEIEITDDMQDYMQLNYTGCLCNTCLKVVQQIVEQ